MKNLSLDQKYQKYLHDGPEPKNKLSNTYNLLDDLNNIDEEMIIMLKIFLLQHKLSTTLKSKPS